MTSFRDRPTGDFLLLMIAGTVCTVVILATCTVLVVEIVNPDNDTSSAASVIRDSLGSLIALLAGFLAGSSAKKSNGNGNDGGPEQVYRPPSE